MNPNPGFVWMKNCFAALAVALTLTWFGTPRAKGDVLAVTCGFPGSSVTTETTLGVSVPCSGQTGLGATYSGSGLITQGIDGITMGSQLTWNGYGPFGGIDTRVNFTASVEGSLPSGSQVMLTTTFAGDGTHGTGPYGGTFSNSFDNPNDTLFGVGNSSSLTINGNTVIPADNGMTWVCTPSWAPNSAYPCSQIGLSGNGSVSFVPRSSSYEATVGTAVSFDFLYSNGMNFGLPASGTFSYDFDPGLTFTATDPTTGAPISGLSLVSSDGMVIPINPPPNTTVPEPSSLMLLGMGALGLFGPARRKLLVAR